jgi:hypothetical protein
LQGRPCNEEQQRQATQQMRNRVRSVLTLVVMQKFAPKGMYTGFSERR